ncbi:Crp/Fnr family transcriptional regulator [Antarctobacter jejuensis]|uniref:Crp/Fnr family transcriptional regulator n=1 Tax=Antarctobacter jejuensis TaxID=1439938 RepID=UPI003FCFF3F4
MSGPFDPVFKDARQRGLATGETLFRGGDACTAMFLVRSGQVGLVRHSLSGAQLNLHSAGPGEIIAEASAYSETYHCDGVAEADSRLSVLPKPLFLSRLDADPALARAWATRLAQGLQQARLRTEIRGLRRVSDRLDAWLSAGGHVPAHGELQRLAEILGVSREALYREMARRR